MACMNDPRRRPVGLLFSLSLLAGACGGSTSSSAGGPDGSVEAGVDAGEDAGCTFEPAGGAFTFHVKNSGTKTLYLTFGCGKQLPFTVDSAAGPLPISRPMEKKHATASA